MIEPGLPDSADVEADLPCVTLGAGRDEIRLALEQLQRAVLRHPVAAQAAFRSLCAEGRQFAMTAEGARWQTRIAQSRLCHELTATFDLACLSLLDADNSATLPGNLLDALFTLAAVGGGDAALGELYRWKSGPDD